MIRLALHFRAAIKGFIIIIIIIMVVTVLLTRDNVVFSEWLNYNSSVILNQTIEYFWKEETKTK